MHAINIIKGRRHFRRVIAVIIFTVLSAVSAHAESDRKINKDESNIAIGGYDTVAYFTKKQPVQGKAEFEHLWQEAKWLFSSAEHRDMFAKDPDRYAPRYGGFCAMAMARGLEYTVDPKAWVIVKGKLYLNYSQEFTDEFLKDPDTAITDADDNWLTLGKLN